MEKNTNIELLDGIIHINGIGIPFLNPLEFDKLVTESEIFRDFGKILDEVIEFSKKYDRKYVKIEMSDSDLEKFYWEQV